MGLFDWFKSSTSRELERTQPRPAPKPRQAPKAGPKVTATMSVGFSPLVQLAGTTTNSKEAAVALVQRHQLADRVALYLTGTAQLEPDNPYDKEAVAVLVEGERIGYLPGYAAQSLALGVGASRTVPLQLFCADVGTGVRVEAFGWLADGEPQWQYGTDNPPALTPTEKRMAAHKSSSRMVRTALADGGMRGEQFQAGLVNGVHYLELVEPIKQLKREGQLEEALTLCYAAIEGAENARDGREPAPFYTEQAAIIHRKLGQKDQEIKVLERWLKFVPAGARAGTGLGERLAKLTS